MSGLTTSLQNFGSGLLSWSAQNIPLVFILVVTIIALSVGLSQEGFKAMESRVFAPWDKDFVEGAEPPKQSSFIDMFTSLLPGASPKLTEVAQIDTVEDAAEIDFVPQLEDPQLEGPRLEDPQPEPELVEGFAPFRARRR